MEAPDDATMAKINLVIGSHGAVRSETLKAFIEKEFHQMVASLP